MSEIDMMTYVQVTGVLSVIVFYLCFDLPEHRYNINVFVPSYIFMLTTALVEPSVGGGLLVIYLGYSSGRDIPYNRMLSDTQALYMQVAGCIFALVTIVIICYI